MIHAITQYRFFKFSPCDDNGNALKFQLHVGSAVHDVWELVKIKSDTNIHSDVIQVPQLDLTSAQELSAADDFEKFCLENIKDPYRLQEEVYCNIKEYFHWDVLNDIKAVGVNRSVYHEDETGSKYLIDNNSSRSTFDYPLS